MDQKTLLLWLATLLCWGVSPVLEKLGLRRVDPIVGLFTRTFAAFLGISFVVFFTSGYEKLKILTLKDFFYLALSGLMSGFLGMYFYFSLLKGHQASQIVPLTATYPLVASVLAILILKESLTLNKLLGTFLIVIGIYLLFKNN